MTGETARDAAPAPGAGPLAFEAVTFGYGARVVVDDLTLCVEPGEMVGLLGPNGAGKSTVLKLASGLIAPTAGRVTLAGQPLAELSRKQIARRLSVVPQDFSVQFAYTVRQIVELGRMAYWGPLARRSEADRVAIERAIETTDTSHLADRVFNELSGGERQRVLLALALAQETPVILLDEPTAHLDIRFQVETLDLVRRLNRERGTTVVAALHDLNLASRYFPRLVVFDGSVVADGPPARVLDDQLLSRVYGTPVHVGRLPGERHITIMPETTGN